MFYSALRTTRALAVGALLLAIGLLANVSRAEHRQSKVEPKPLRIALYGDCRDGHAVHRKIVALIMREKPDLVINTGDLVHRGSEANLWRIYDEITGDMRKAIPLYTARGNHDVGGPGYAERVTAPFSSGNKLWYSFERGTNHFIGLAVDESTPFEAGTPQYKWLIQDLEAARSKHAENIFVFFHVPPYSIGSHGSDADVQKALCPVFDRYGVRAVFNGHDHNYYRTKRNGIPYIVTGGGGAPLYPADPSNGAIPGDKYASTNNFVMVEVRGTHVTGRALRADGSIIDTFTLHE